MKSAEKGDVDEWPALGNRRRKMTFSRRGMVAAPGRYPLIFSLDL
jgi:hypothetical protein